MAWRPACRFPTRRLVLGFAPATSSITASWPEGSSNPEDRGLSPRHECRRRWPHLSAVPAGPTPLGSARVEIDLRFQEITQTGHQLKEVGLRCVGKFDSMSYRASSPNASQIRRVSGFCVHLSSLRRCRRKLTGALPPANPDASQILRSLGSCSYLSSVRRCRNPLQMFCRGRGMITITLWDVSR
jgi:hypothetical protein